MTPYPQPPVRQVRVRRPPAPAAGSVHEPEILAGHNFKTTIANLDFEEAARFRDELKRLQAVELAIAADPLASQRDVEAEAGAYAGERSRTSRPPKWGRIISAAATPRRVAAQARLRKTSAKIVARRAKNRCVCLFIPHGSFYAIF
jgi:UvrB/uvrC motif